MRPMLAVLCSLVLGSSAAFAASGTAELTAVTDAMPDVSGTATLQDTPEGLRIGVQVAGVPPGKHGLHVHQYGLCDDLGMAAGGHYNPAGVRHGFVPSDGPANAHAGDFGNIEVGEDGAGTLQLVVPGVTLGDGPRTVGGRAIVLHEKADDFGQPTGNAGGRLACGPILVTGE